jgi:hypothetical protein
MRNDIEFKIGESSGPETDAGSDTRRKECRRKNAFKTVKKKMILKHFIVTCIGKLVCVQKARCEMEQEGGGAESKNIG